MSDRTPATTGRPARRPSPTHKVLRIRLDLTIEADKPFPLPDLDTHYVALAVTILAAAVINAKRKVGLGLTPLKAYMRLDMLDKPPKLPKGQEEKKR